MTLLCHSLFRFLRNEETTITIPLGGDVRQPFIMSKFTLGTSYVDNDGNDNDAIKYRISHLSML